MKKIVGRAYSGMINSVLRGINPLKKRIVDTPCLVHIMINNGSIEELKVLGYHKEFSWFNEYKQYLNSGVVWADQDFKSINHFFHHKKRRGLFGFKDAYGLFSEYYEEAIKRAKDNDYKKSMFYLGAALHLLHDSTVPHHVLNKLLLKHRKFEQWIIKNFAKRGTKIVTREALMYDKVESYVFNNVEFSYKTYIESKQIRNEDERYHFIGRKIIKRSQSSTAGLLVKFYNENIIT